VSWSIPDPLAALCCPKDASGNGECRNARSKMHVRRKFAGMETSESKNIGPEKRHYKGNQRSHAGIRAVATVVSDRVEVPRDIVSPESFK
jgi:hypothetical protein